MRRLFLVAASLAILCVAGTASATTTPGVNATPGNSGSHPWKNDGCTIVADKGLHKDAYYDFNHACIHHDGCYGKHWASRATCDEWFLNDMYASCRYLFSGQGCYDRARLYYGGVRALGAPFFAAYSHLTRM